MASDTTVKESETTVSDGDRTKQEGSGRSTGNNAFAGWLASSTLRIGLVLVGLLLLLVALGQLSGFDILGEIVAILGTQAGRWVFVAVVAIGLIVVAVRGFPGLFE